VTVEVAKTVVTDGSLAYVSNSAWFPLTPVGTFAFGQSTVALQATWNVATAGPNAVALSNQIQTIQQNVFSKPMQPNTPWGTVCCLRTTQ